jgi:hypothetical protein
VIIIPASIEVALCDDDGQQLGGTIKQETEFVIDSDELPDGEWSMQLKGDVVLPAFGRVPFESWVEFTPEAREAITTLRDDCHVRMKLNVPIPPNQIMKTAEGRTYRGWNLNVARAAVPNSQET